MYIPNLLLTTPLVAGSRWKVNKVGIQNKAYYNICTSTGCCDRAAVVIETRRSLNFKQRKHTYTGYSLNRG